MNGDSHDPLAKLEWPETKYMPPAIRDFKERFDAAMQEHSARAKLKATDTTSQTAADAEQKAAEQRRLKRIRELASNLKPLTTPAEVLDRWRRIAAVVDKLTNLLGETK